MLATRYGEMRGKSDSRTLSNAWLMMDPMYKVSFYNRGLNECNVVKTYYSVSP